MPLLPPHFPTSLPPFRGLSGLLEVGDGQILPSLHTARGEQLKGALLPVEVAAGTSDPDLEGLEAKDWVGSGPSETHCDLLIFSV